MRVWLKWVGIICLIPVVLLLIVSILLYLPPFQQFVLKKATRYASEASGMEIDMQRIILSFPLDVSVDGLTVSSAATDTLLAVDRLSLRILPAPLLKKIISVDKLEVEQVVVHSGTLIEGMEVDGTFDRLSARAKHIGLNEEKAVIDDVRLSSAAITVRIDSLSQDDSPSEPLDWELLLKQISLEQVCFALQMNTSPDSLRVGTYIDVATLREGAVYLADARYQAAHFLLSGSSLDYRTGHQEPLSGLDPSHIVLNNLNISVDSLYYQEGEARADIQNLSAEERSGLTISSLRGKLSMDSTLISIPDLLLKTPGSEARLLAEIPQTVFNPVSQGNMRVLFTASVGKKDLFTLLNGMPKAFENHYPDTPFSLATHVEGNLSLLNIRQLKAELPAALVLDATGQVGAVTDSVRRSADIRLQAQSRKMDFLLGLLPAEQRERFLIPAGIKLSGNLSLKEQTYAANLLCTEDKAKVTLDAQYNIPGEIYQASLSIDSLEPQHFLPHDSLMWLAAELRAEGQGTDPFASRTTMELKGRIERVGYAGISLKDITLGASLKEHQLQAELNSLHPDAAAGITLDGTLREDELSAMLIADIDSINLRKIGLTTDSFSTSFQVFAEMESDYQKRNKLDVTLGNWELVTGRNRIHPKTLTLHARSDEDTTRVSFHVGDLGITLTGNADPETMLNRISLVSSEMTKQMKEDSLINIAALRPSFPDVSLRIVAGKDNPAYNILQHYDMGFSRFDLEALASPEDGLLMDASLYTLHRDTFLIDTVMVSIRPTEEGLNYRLNVLKNRYMQQTPFRASLQGSVKNRYVDTELLYKNEKQETGVQLGIRATKETDGFKFRLFPERPVLAFHSFSLNADNYIRMKNPKDIEANVRFTGGGNTSFWLHTVESGGDFPEQHIELSQVDLEALSEGFPWLPNMRGILSADIQYAPSEESFMVVLDTHVDTLIYEKGRVGELMLNAVYLPLDDASHQIDIHFSQDREEVASATALYYSAKKNDNLEGSLNLTTLPMAMLSPFIPDKMASLSGALNGELSIRGSASAPKVNGYMQFDTASVYITAANASVRPDNRKIEVKDSRVLFDKYAVYSSGTNPLVIDGNVDFRNLSKMTADLKLNASDLQLLNSKKSRESIVYGKMLVSLSATAKGALDALNVRGNMQLLGGTDLVYIMTESPLTVQDRLKDLVTFTSFTDTLIRVRRRQGPLPLGGMNMLMTLRIDPIVHLRVDLSPDRSSYVELEGGGDLSFQYTSQGDMLLNGRYTLSDGKIKYALPVIPLKEFAIKADSYVQWDGDMMNPLLNLAATERMRASVSTAGENSRMVDFDVGIDLKERLDNMSLMFTIAAPGDMSMQTTLSSKGAEERSKLAVGMMVTGMYMEGGSGVNLNMGDALSSFLQSEINNIAGDALKTVDISFGMDSYDQDSEMGGGSRTDYSFQFAKRFYNDRLRVVVGGKVSTGNVQQNDAFLDNASVEWRLDAAGTRYLKLFHDRNYESLLEGEVVETGVGVVLRRKMLHLRELFNFKKKKVQPIPEDREEAEYEKDEAQ
ncbi:hypothetical protein M2459_002519 [Parabacteroides sp. PF5-5]|uniref:translocation/assembly module TamB domain-containing protein n=1 Tax=unclassified Parabacteroides TaxID=2649774 RepID=UPI0024761EA8|nr:MULTISPECIES: translocation/assembly module TamB domain-containing protein [unclassified Parabacteroides]MDH6305725.1 hypothetical protein [Parabacteroides sp. PH5-39]MDH6316797.1 hypothetical protein [Parabacteroides sp. PF5-13]MDH6320438.1 hypothetical protein [Parabacteroides sp. PH5-13]MDH6324168.1 hypothetical protein [Parabacteroides sp. PH5-8]MDH6327983.1 hypothetical protein [Parabacteroides sp. PH5-41]